MVRRAGIARHSGHPVQPGSDRTGSTTRVAWELPGGYLWALDATPGPKGLADEAEIRWRAE